MYEDPLVEAVRPDGAIEVAQSAARGRAPLAELSVLAWGGSDTETGERKAVSKEEVYKFFLPSTPISSLPMRDQCHHNLGNDGKCKQQSGFLKQLHILDIKNEELKKMIEQKKVIQVIIIANSPCK